jgi:hypothetical protein
MFTWSNEPYKDMWAQLSLLENSELVEEILLGKVKTKRSVIYSEDEDYQRKAKQISMCIRQAKEFFNVLEVTTITTSPLHLFYGMLALAKALIIANKKEYFIEDIRYHGLCSRPITNELKAYSQDKNSWEMGKEYAIVNDGIFKILFEVFDGEAIKNNSIIRFQSLIKSVPEIRNIYTKFTGERSNSLSLYSLNVIENPFSAKVSFQLELDEIFSCLPVLKEKYIILDKKLHDTAFTFETTDKYLFIHSLKSYNSRVGGRYVVGALDWEIDGNVKNILLSQSVIDYVAVYILSNCARYKQEYWQDLISGKEKGIIGILQIFIDRVKMRFPLTIMEAIWNEDFYFGSPAYLE